MPPEELLTANTTAFVAGAPLKAVYKAARERLPARLVVRREGRMLFRPAAAVCFRIDRSLPKDVPAKVRSAFYADVQRDPRAERLEHKVGHFSYVVDLAAANAEVARELEAYREAMSLIVEDPEIQAGAATFRGTRILVHTVADLLKVGASGEELKADFPNLTNAMLAAAPVYARAHPRRGRPRTPGRRPAAARSERRRPRTAA